MVTLAVFVGVALLALLLFDRDAWSNSIR